MKSIIQQPARSQAVGRRSAHPGALRLAVTAIVVGLAAVGLVLAGRVFNLPSPLRGLLPGWPWW